MPYRTSPHGRPQPTDGSDGPPPLRSLRRARLALLCAALGGFVLPRPATAEGPIEHAINKSRLGDLNAGTAALEKVVTENGPSPMRRSALRLLSIHHLALSNRAAAVGDLRQLLESSDYGENQLEEEHGLGVTRDNLRLWYLLTAQGEKQAAADQLTAALRRSEEKDTLCYTDFARFLLGTLPEDRFLVLKQENGHWCTFSLAASPALARFYVALRAMTNGDQTRALPLLRQFLQEKEPNLLWEQSVARLLLGDSLFPPPDEDTPSPAARRNSCGCEARTSTQCAAPRR